MRKIVPIVSALIIFLCTIQAFYYPIFGIPGEEAWWQIGWMAAIGFLVGLPAMLVAEDFSVGFAWIAAAIWSVLLAFGLSALVGLFLRKTREG